MVVRYSVLVVHKCSTEALGMLIDATTYTNKVNSPLISFSK